LDLVDNILLSQPAGFVNDITFTNDAAYLTDSFGKTDGEHRYYRLPLDPASGLPDPGGVTTILLAGDWLILVNSSTGVLYRVDPMTGEVTSLDLGGEAVLAGDGLVINGMTLYVVDAEFGVPGATYEVIRVDK
jgi:hypothetical protein